MNTPEYHNPDNLTPEQVGEGWRLLLKEERAERYESCAEISRDVQSWSGSKWCKHGMYGTSKNITYRVQWPLPEKYRQPTIEQRVEKLEKEIAALAVNKQDKVVDCWGDMSRIKQHKSEYQDLVRESKKKGLVGYLSGLSLVVIENPFYGNTPFSEEPIHLNLVKGKSVSHDLLPDLTIRNSGGEILPLKASQIIFTQR